MFQKGIDIDNVAHVKYYRVSTFSPTVNSRWDHTRFPDTWYVMALLKLKISIHRVRVDIIVVLR